MGGSWNPNQPSSIRNSGLQRLRKADVVVDHGCIAGDCLWGFLAGLTVDETHSLDPIRVSERCPQRDEAALAHANEDCGSDVEVIQKGNLIAIGST